MEINLFREIKYSYAIILLRMKKTRYALIPFAAFVLYVMLTASSNGRATAANDDRTGAPGSNGTCGSCHNGGSFGTVTAVIQIFAQGTTNAVTSYTAGSTYDVRVTISNSTGTPAGYGFEFTCLTSPGNVAVANAYTNLGSNVKQKLITTGTFNGKRYVEHMGVTATNTFNFRWTAPTAGTGTVKFYASGVAVNLLNGDNGDNAAAGTSLTITESVPLSSSGVVTNVSCNGGSNGAINLTAVGGSSPYTYNWGNGITSEDRTNLTAGNYNVTITDNASVVSTATFTVTEPIALAISGSTTVVLCNGGNTGAINITVSGGTPNYTYNWGGGITTEDRNNVSSGNYSVTVTDSKGCIASASFTVTQPSVLIAGNNHGNIECFGGTTTVNVTATGGTSPYSGTGNFTASNGTTNYTVTDNNGCTASTSATLTQPALLTASNTTGNILCFGETTTVAISASGGTPPYTGTGNFTAGNGTTNFSVTDNNGCIASTNITLTQPALLTADANDISIACVGGSGTVTVSASGGTSPYTGTGNFTVTTPGIQNYTVSDANGCTTSTSSTVSSTSGLNVTDSVTEIKCHAVCNASIVTTVSGGTTPYTYNWSNSSTLSSITSLCAGTYIQTVTDNANCSIVNTFVINEVDSLQLSITKDSILCYDETSLLTATISGGVSPYNFSWSNTATTDTTTVIAGVYTLTITDQNGCSISQQTVVSQPYPLDVITDSVVQNAGNGLGAIYISPIGGSAPYTFMWSNGAVTEDVLQLAPGIYSVTVIDANGCTFDISNFNILSVGIETISNSGFNFYPNPVSYELFFETLQAGYVKIFSPQGVLMKNIFVEAGKNRFDLSELLANIYLIEIRTTERTEQLKLIKQ